MAVAADAVVRVVDAALSVAGGPLDTADGAGVEAPCPSSQESVGVLGGAFEEIGTEDPDAVDGNVDHIYTDVVYAYL